MLAVQGEFFFADCPALDGVVVFLDDSGDGFSLFLDAAACCAVLMATPNRAR